ncbi:hypothetical protein OAP51_05895 [Alphaproteobacteria bacterium]|nr:hypothetical protein [Alphaproteobacteria bacterium]
MIEWIRGNWRYTLRTDGLMAEIQLDHIDGAENEVTSYPNSHFTIIILSREFNKDENMDLELLKITGLAKAALRKRGFKELQFHFESVDSENLNGSSKEPTP